MPMYHRTQRMAVLASLLILVLLVGCTEETVTPPAQAPAPDSDTAVITPPTNIPGDSPDSSGSLSSPDSPAVVSPPSGTTELVPPPPSQRILETVRNRGYLVCGVHGNLPGFSMCTSDTDCTGFDADFCRVIATAIFGSPSNVQFRSLSASERFDAVRNGEVDVLLRNTTWTATRDNATEGLDFGPVLFHDGQGFLVPRALNITDIQQLNGRTICVQNGTTSSLNLKEQLGLLGIDFTVITTESDDAAYQAYERGACDAISSDRSQLASRRTLLESPDDHVLLGAIISREPLAPVFVEHESQWRDLIHWAIFATIAAEELDVSSANVASLATTEHPIIRRLLGFDGTIGSDLGVSNDFALRIIERVGNYEEIYNRHLGPTTPINLDRGPNKAWNKGEGGVLSSPPFR